MTAKALKQGQDSLCVAVLWTQLPGENSRIDRKEGVEVPPQGMIVVRHGDMTRNLGRTMRGNPRGSYKEEEGDISGPLFLPNRRRQRKASFDIEQ